MDQAPITGQGAAIKRVWLCADDFALNDAISEGILALLAQQRLSVTSCMTDAPGWPRWGSGLREQGFAARAGLHFNVTEPFPGYSAASLGKTMLKSALRLLDRRALQSSLRRQLDQYEDVMACAPSYVDGHQHVHVFPVVRDILLEELARRYTQRPWLRNVMPAHDPLATKPLKLAVILRMGGERFARMLQARRWPANEAFAGLYGLQPDTDFSMLMYGWLAGLHRSTGGLIMCHPALRVEAGDVIGPARAAEYAWLASDAWPKALRDAGFALDVDGGLPFANKYNNM